MGLSLVALVLVQAQDHSPEWLKGIAAFTAESNAIVEAHRLAGDIDYALRVAVFDTAAYDRFYADLIAAVPVKSVTTRFILEQVKTNGRSIFPPGDTKHHLPTA